MKKSNKELLQLCMILLATVVISVTVKSIFFGDSRREFFENKKPFADKPAIGQMLKDAKVTKHTEKFINGQTANVIQYECNIICPDKKNRTLGVELYYDSENKTDNYTRIDYSIGDYYMSAIDFFSLVYGTDYKFSNLEALSIIENRPIQKQDYEYIMKEESIGGLYMDK